MTSNLDNGPWKESKLEKGQAVEVCPFRARKGHYNVIKSKGGRRIVLAELDGSVGVFVVRTVDGFAVVEIEGRYGRGGKVTLPAETVKAIDAKAK